MATQEQADSFLPKSKYIWCLHCNQVDMRTGWVHNYGYCPYENCNASVMDAWAWTKVRKNRPEYPKIPDYDCLYSLYD